MASSSAPKCRRLEGKSALVTASTAGIGLATARRLAQEGARVVVCSRKSSAVDKTVADLRAEGLEVSGVACHVGSPEQLDALVAFAVQTYGAIDLLVSNAAVNPTAGALADIDGPSVDKILDINVKSALVLTQKALPHMRRGSSIVYVSSFAAYMPSAPIAMYAVSKTALLGLTKAMAAELGPQGIRVNAVCPGVVPTKFAAALVANRELEERAKQAVFLRRLGRGEDMAAAVAFLVSPDADYVTGESLVVAGGVQSRL